MIVNQMIASVSDILGEIYQLPINIEIAHGTLSPERFNFYLQQDSLFLADFSRAIAIAGSRFAEADMTQSFLALATDAIDAERDLHRDYLQNTAQQTHEPTLACFAYTNYLLKIATIAPIEVAVAGLLPCFWIYAQVGNWIKDAASASIDTNPFAAWINLYAGEEFDKSVQTVVDATNLLAESANDSMKLNMLNAFTTATKLEFLFWDHAYHQESMIPKATRDYADGIA